MLREKVESVIERNATAEVKPYVVGLREHLDVRRIDAPDVLADVVCVLVDIERTNKFAVYRDSPPVDPPAGVAFRMSRAFPKPARRVKRTFRFTECGATTWKVL